jgi:anion-transporting  ArsA/GET3 family ATPase
MLPTLTIFCGKGGVGKTTLSLASALVVARRRPVLLVTSHPLDELALAVSLKGLDEVEPASASRLFVVHIDSRQVLRRMVVERFPAGFVADRLLKSAVYQSFIEVVPGLKEFAFLHRLQELAERRNSDGFAYDHVIWDAPATGHFTQTLRVAVNFEAFFAGPLASRSKEVSDYLRRSEPRIIPVALAEEMSVEETLDLVAELRSLGVNPKTAACNLASPLLVRWWRDGEDLAASPDSPWRAFLAQRLAAERAEFQRLCEGCGAAVLIRRLPHRGSDLRFLLDLSREIEDSGLLNVGSGQ